MQRPVKSSRAYESPERVARASETARKILVAAELLFRRDGFAAVTMKAIARETGVAVATVYLHFEGKAAIVAALSEQIVGRPDLSVEILEDAGELESVLRHGARITRDLNQRSWAVAETLRAHGETNPILKALALDWKRRHLDASRRAAKAMAGAATLRAGLSEGQVADLLYAVTGTDVYRALVHERGWQGDEYETWLVEWAKRELFVGADQT